MCSVEASSSVRVHAWIASRFAMSTSDRTTIRVLYLLPDFDLAGGQVVVRRTINALSEPELDHVVVAFAGGPLLDAYRHDGIRCEVIGNGTKTSWPAALVRLVRLVRRERIDVMLSANTPLDRTMAQLGAAVTRRPVVIWFHSIAIPLIGFPPPSGRRLAFVKRLVLHPFNVVSVRCAAALVATSDAVASSFADHLRLRADRIEVVPPGLPESAFDPALEHEHAEMLRSEFALGDDHPVLLGVGMLIPLKGQRQLIEMLELLAADFPRAHLLLAGEGPDRAALETRISESPVRDHVHLLGHRTDIPDLLRISDGLLSASRSEGFGMSVLEAMAASLPVIGVRTPAFLEFLDEGVTAELVDSQDAHQLADGVRAVFSDPMRAERMGALGRQRALDFRASLRAGELGEILRRAAGRRPSGPRATTGGEGMETTPGVVAELPVRADPHSVDPE